MDNMTKITLELGINAQRFIQQVQVHNETIEEEISKGIQLALEEILSGDNFSLKIKEQTLKSIDDIVSKAIFSYEVRMKISKMIEEKIGEKLNEYADKIAEKITSDLKT